MNKAHKDSFGSAASRRTRRPCHSVFFTAVLATFVLAACDVNWPFPIEIDDAGGDTDGPIEPGPLGDYYTYYLHMDQSYDSVANNECLNENAGANNLYNDIKGFRSFLQDQGWAGVYAHDNAGNPSTDADIYAYPNAFAESSLAVPGWDPVVLSGEDHMRADSAGLVVFSGHGWKGKRAYAMSKKVHNLDGGGPEPQYVGTLNSCSIPTAGTYLGALEGAGARVVIYHASCMGYSGNLFQDASSGFQEYWDFMHENQNNRVWKYLAFVDSPESYLYSLTDFGYSLLGSGVDTGNDRTSWIETQAHPQVSYYNQPIIYSMRDETESNFDLDARHNLGNLLYKTGVPDNPPTTFWEVTRMTASITQDDPFGSENDDTKFSTCYY